MSRNRTALQSYNALVAEMERLHPPTCPCCRQAGPPLCDEGPADEQRLATAFVAMPLWARVWTIARAGLWRDAVYEIRHNTTGARAHYARLGAEFDASYGPVADTLVPEVAAAWDDLQAAFDAMPRWARAAGRTAGWWRDASHELRRSP